jgi:hypothetical protein
MTKRQAKLYTERVKELMAEKSRLLSQAQALADMGLEGTARPVWSHAASYEERIAPLLDAIGRDAEAALHRISAAACFEKSGEPSRAEPPISTAPHWPVRSPTRPVRMWSEKYPPASYSFIEPWSTRSPEPGEVRPRPPFPSRGGPWRSGASLG